MRALRFASPFLFALSVPVLYYSVAPCAPFLTVAALLAALIGAEFVSIRGSAAPPGETPRAYRFLPILYVPIQLAVIAWALFVARETSGVGLAAFALSIGVTTGVFGVLAAHELVHGHDRAERTLGLALLTGMTYRHFRIAHVYGHHRYAATDRDPASARLGEGFYAFLVRTVATQFTDAWGFERQRIARHKGGLLENRVARDVMAMLIVYLAIGALFGPAGVVFFAAESAVAILVLEMFNYIAHYGLRRRSTESGREPFGRAHSWNSSNVLANALIFNMGRHSAHHARPDAPYESLTWIAAAPELPAGYAGSILLALVPPLWRRVMDPAVARLHTPPMNESARISLA
jgi:alkane 1-monooxygenase